MSSDTALHSRLHARFQETFGPPHHDLHETEQWSLVPSSGQGAINVLLNGTPKGPLVWVFNSQDIENGARHFAVTQEHEIDELIDQLRNTVMRAPERGTGEAAARTPFLEDVLTTEQLAMRPSRPPNYAAENEALFALVQRMARDPQSILQLTVDTAMHLCRGQSAGISILEPQGETEVFRWHATAGAYSPHVGSTMPRNGPCGAVIDRNALLMFDLPELFYQFTAPVDPPIEEVILAPFHSEGRPVGTVWVMAHAKDRKFDREDARLLASVAHFAAAAYQVISALNSAQAGRTEMTSARDMLVIHSDELETIVAQRTGELVTALQELRLSERMSTMGTLSAGLGHDMGNMVLAMRARLELLRQSAGSPNEHVEVLCDCVTYLQNLASGLRLMSIDPADKRLGPEKVSLAAWWTAAHRVVASGVGTDIFVEGRVPEDLPEVLVNRAGLTQAVYNVVQNAADAMKGRRGRIMISAERDATQPRVQFRISDEGSGMTDEVRQRCMDPYFSAKTTSTSTGIGLALVHSVMMAARGSIRIETKLGRGTTFILAFPIAK